jgi:hypothetical protein
MRRGSFGVSSALMCVLALALAMAATPVDGQTRFMNLSGQTVSPAFEGWWPNDDGSYTLFFGYMNSNWKQEFVIPVGSENYFAYSTPGALDDTETDAYDMSVADQGQPTHFYPRRNPFLFTIVVPADFGSGELVWTLKTQSRSIRAYGTLAPDYRIDPQVISTEVGGDYGSLNDALRTNIPPMIDIEGSMTRTVQVGEMLQLSVYAEDPDNLPRRRNRGGLPTTPEQLYRPPSSIVAISGPGLRFAWSVYRGDAEEVTFDPVQMKTWTDTRVYANSAWSPPWVIPEPPEDNRWISEVTFDEPGEYTLRAVASDGSMFMYENVMVTVTPLVR